MDQTFVRKRLQDVINERGLSMRQVSLAAGLNSAAVRNLITGRTQSIGMETLAKILRAMDMTEEKFFLRASAPVGTVEAGAYTIPVCGEIPAGNPNYQEGIADPVDTIPGDDRDRRYGAFALRVSGFSMAPKYLPGDTLILKPLHVGLPVKDPLRITPRAVVDALAGRSVAVLVNGEATLKKLEIEPRPGGDYMLHLKPINPDYPTITIGDNDSVLFQGEVYKLIREE
jgi:SOS-response transcriptional repressor LexA